MASNTTASPSHHHHDASTKKEESKTEHVVILGSGPSGLTAAIYAARANLNPLVLHGILPGGQLTQTSEIENFPGFKGEGNHLIDTLMEQAKSFGARFDYQTVVSVDFSKHPHVIQTNQSKILTETLIISTGASPRKLGIPGEQENWGKGVTSCATCDGFFFKKMEIAVVGGGDSAAEEALFLTRFATKVYLIHRRDVFRASKIMLKRVMENPKIEIIQNTVVEEVIQSTAGEPKLSAIKIKDIVTNQTKSLAVKGLFLAIGHIPNTEIFKGKLKIDDQGYILTEAHSTRTNVPGVFAAGDVQDSVFRQAITAAGTGCMAAIEAERYLAETE